MTRPTTRPTPATAKDTAEDRRLAEDGRRERNWKRWGPYLAERQWGTVREDYSEHGDCWSYFPHDHARSRAYRWGEDGLLGLCDRQGHLNFALALWNERDPILKERLFGLTGPEGNHGEDVKECYFYLDSTPTHSYLKALYKYPQAAFPYARLVEENRRRGRHEREFELEDSGVFDEERYFDVVAEYAKAGPNDICIRIRVANRGPEAAAIHVLPTLWYRNTWAWGRQGEGYWPKPRIVQTGPGRAVAESDRLGRMILVAEGEPALLFTDNETNTARLFGAPNATPWVKDAFHRHVVDGEAGAVNPAGEGTKVAAHHRLVIPAGEERTLALRLFAESDAPGQALGAAHAEVLRERAREADEFYAARLPAAATPDEANVIRQGYAGLLTTKQFYHLAVRDWLEGDPSQPPPPAARRRGRNAEWSHVYARDVISMPDKWEYPWFAAWDVAFQMLPFAPVDPAFAKEQLILFLREWYMHPNGQIPAYEFAFGDVNPPVHAWAAWRIYKTTGPRAGRDRVFLSRVFQKLLLNFTWWVNRKDSEGDNIFGGGFLGLDNIGVFDRSRPLPTGGHLEQADGTAWMAFFCSTMLSMALELAQENPACEDLASKFFEHFVAIGGAINSLGGTGLWDETDGFYYDQLHVDGRKSPLRVRSLVGLMPLIACQILEQDVIDRLPGFARRMRWFLEHRPSGRALPWEYATANGGERHGLLAIASRERLERVLRHLLDENEFLSPYGIRSVSKAHAEQPYVFDASGEEYRVAYSPGESETGLFGGNSNWRGPIWFPVNYLLVEALERYGHFYGDDLRVECPTGSGRWMNLREVAHELTVRLGRMFLRDEQGHRPIYGDDERWATRPAWRDLVLFHEYFHGDTGRGLGASHQTGWTALAVRCLEDAARARGTTTLTRRAG
jgi:hypothetical protein